MQNRLDSIFANFTNAHLRQNIGDLALAEPQIMSGKEIAFESKTLIGGMLRPLFSKEIQSGLIMISQVALPSDFPVRFPKARPVILEKSTQVFANPRLVAIFPENWKDGYCREYSLYFVNRFTLRTTAAIKDMEAQISGLPRLFQINIDDRPTFEILAAQWVTLHESFHATGKFPYSNNIRIKSSLYSSAIEELRVDLLSINWCNKNSYFHLAEYIFFERVLRYILDSSTENDCDGLSSRIALTYLFQNQHLKIVNDKIHLSKYATTSIIGLLIEIGNFEKMSSELNFREAARLFCQNYLKENIEPIIGILKKNRDQNMR